MVIKLKDQMHCEGVINNLNSINTTFDFSMKSYLMNENFQLSKPFEQFKAEPRYQKCTR